MFEYATFILRLNFRIFFYNWLRVIKRLFIDYFGNLMFPKILVRVIDDLLIVLLLRIAINVYNITKSNAKFSFIVYTSFSIPSTIFFLAHLLLLLSYFFSSFFTFYFRLAFPILNYVDFFSLNLPVFV